MQIKWTESSTIRPIPVLEIRIIAERFNGGDDRSNGFIFRNEVRREDLLEFGRGVVSTHNEDFHGNVALVGGFADVGSADEELEHLILVLLEAAGDAHHAR